MRLLYDNKALIATITTSSENPNYPIENLNDSRLAKQFRSLGDSINIVITGQIKASYIAILNHNLTDSADLTLQGNDTNVWTSPSMSVAITDIDTIILKNFTEVTYNYYRLVINDSDSGADGYIKIGLIYLGAFFQMPGMKPDQDIGFNTTSKSTISFSGQAYGDIRYTFRDYKINFPLLTHTQRANLITVYANNLNVKPLIMILWANDQGYEAPVYCIIDQPDLSFKRNPEFPNLPWATSIKFKEVF